MSTTKNNSYTYRPTKIAYLLVLPVESNCSATIERQEKAAQNVEVRAIGTKKRRNRIPTRPLLELREIELVEERNGRKTHGVVVQKV